MDSQLEHAIAKNLDKYGSYLITQMIPDSTKMGKNNFFDKMLKRKGSKVIEKKIIHKINT